MGVIQGEKVVQDVIDEDLNLVNTYNREKTNQLRRSKLHNFHEKSKEDHENLQKIRVTNELYNRIVVVEYVSVFFSTIAVALSIVMCELTLESEIDLDQLFVFQSYVPLITLIFALTLYMRYDLYLQWFKSKGLLTEFDSITSTGWWRGLVLEILMALIGPYPFL